MSEIYKAAGIIIIDRKVLAARTRGKTAFVNPGGKLEGDETYKQALVRELKEELDVDVLESDMEELGSWEADAVYNPGTLLRMTAYLVAEFTGEIKPMNEVEELAWLSSDNGAGLELASILEHDILPLLKSKNLID